MTLRRAAGADDDAEVTAQIERIFLSRRGTADLRADVDRVRRTRSAVGDGDAGELGALPRVERVALDGEVGGVAAARVVGIDVRVAVDLVDGVALDGEGHRAATGRGDEDAVAGLRSGVGHARHANGVVGELAAEQRSGAGFE